MDKLFVCESRETVLFIRLLGDEASRADSERLLKTYFTVSTN